MLYALNRIRSKGFRCQKNIGTATIQEISRYSLTRQPINCFIRKFLLSFILLWWSVEHSIHIRLHKNRRKNRYAPKSLRHFYFCRPFTCRLMARGERIEDRMEGITNIFLQQLTWETQPTLQLYEYYPDFGRVNDLEVWWITASDCYGNLVKGDLCRIPHKPPAEAVLKNSISKFSIEKFIHLHMFALLQNFIFSCTNWLLTIPDQYVCLREISIKLDRVV